MELKPSDLRKFFAFESINDAIIRQLADETESKELAAGDQLFAAGDAGNDSYFLLSGSIQGAYPDGREKKISGDTTQARYAIGDLSPRRFTAKVTSRKAVVVRINRSYLEKVLSFDQLVRSGRISLFDGSRDAARWILRMLKSRTFQSLPAGNFERLLERLEPVDVMSGEVIIREGDAGDYFYVIKSGSAAVSQMKGDGEATIAYLVRGDSFGEDALISNDVRNATITMKKNGSLLRLAKKDFAELLKSPMVRWLSPGQASIKVRTGAQLVDVRLNEEYEQQCIRSALNIPLYQLRDRLDELDKSKTCVLYCNTGERSASAAFVLSNNGFSDVYALSGGLSAMLRTLSK